jgi:hypothetical protein
VLAAALVALLAAPALALERGDGADGRFAERRSSHFVLRQDVDLDDYHGPHGALAFERQVLAVLEEAHDALDARLGLRAPRPLEVHVWDPAVFDATFAGLFPFPAAGFYGGTIHVRGDVAVTVALRRTLRHELVHATVDAEAPSLVLPAWLHEGLAEWFESRGGGGGGHLTAHGWSALSRAAREGTLPSLAALSAPTLAHLEPRAAGVAYLYAHGLVDHLARRRGEDALRRLVEEIVRTGHLPRAFRRIARATPEELDASFRRELEGG